ncbi:FAD-binding oxidoreductase [Pontibacter pamirensis]|uniref:FAD-binding oxidoreductase n=1 Tax=Pontibacter pamirensis TaxID=2562824 RepID=UPI001389F9BE|nr:FAD-binding oxidoreductase [Pontibacter pamirensis]
MLAEETSLSHFKTSLRGRLIAPADPDYEMSRKVYNGMIDKRPALIARCLDEADVIAAVNFARVKNLLVAVRGGGHSGAGMGMCDGGLVIDLSYMKATHVDPAARTVQVQGGCTLGDVDHATHAFGMAVPTGIQSTTGIAGLTLGGGIGHLTRQCGLTIDNLLEADVVLASGEYVKASAREHSDLFWALRGGGGNFGVVTSFLFQTHPISTVYAGPMLWDLEDAKEMMRWYHEFISNAPDDINGFFAFLIVPPDPSFPVDLHLKSMCGVVWCYTGPMEEAEKAFEPIRGFKKPALDFVGPMPVPVLQSMFDPLVPSGYQWYWKGDYVKDLPDEAIDICIHHGSKVPNMYSGVHLYPINGAAARVDNNATAWSYRDATYAMVIVGVDPEPTNKHIITNWSRDFWKAIHPYSAGGSYINFMMEEGQDRVKATYGDNYQRLVEVKTKYDPHNLFRVNQNILPAVTDQA